MFKFYFFDYTYISVFNWKNFKLFLLLFVCLCYNIKINLFLNLYRLFISIQVRNGAKIKPMRCLDCAVSRREKKKPVSLYPCHSQGGNQASALL